MDINDDRGAFFLQSKSSLGFFLLGSILTCCLYDFSFVEFEKKLTGYPGCGYSFRRSL